MIVNNEFVFKANKTLIYFLSVAISTLSASCVYVDLIEKPNPEVKIELPSLMVDSLKSSSYTVEINGQKIVIDSANPRIPNLPSGTYPTLIYNNVSTINIIDGIAEVNQVNGQLNSFPDWLFAGYTNLIITNSLFEKPEIKMDQQVRLLKLVIDVPEGGVYERVTSIVAKLTGVAGRWDIKNNIPVGPAMEVSLVFKKQNDNKWVAETRLLGIFGDKQELIGNIIYTDIRTQMRKMSSTFSTTSNQQFQIGLYSDLSGDLNDFNTGKEVPLDISGKIEVPTEVGFNAIINDWIKVSESGTAW